MERHVEATTEFLSERQRHQTLGLADVVSNGNARGPLAPTIARQIYSEVIAKGWPVGDLLGSEAELLARYRVSRSVFRESLRLLEFNGVVTTRRGLGGGIFVSRPDVGATVEAMASYIESRGITPEQLFEVRQAIELAAVDLAATRIDADGERQLEATIEAENRGDLRVLAQALHLRIAEITGNRILHLFLHALTLLAEAHTLGPTEQTVTEAEALENVQRIHRAIVDAIVSGDMALARRRMERHLVALVPYQH
jgi:DNA-binding FadR family transcriptional regulator